MPGSIFGYHGPHIVFSLLKTTGGELYHGKSDGNRHAETDALGAVPDGVQIESVALSSDWPGYDGISHAVPCHACCAALAPRMASGATVDITGAGIFHFATLAAAYRTYDEPGSAVLTLTGTVGSHLTLSPIDCAILRRFVSECGESAQVYLTGTASGRGGARALVNEDQLGCPYQDLDVVLAGDVTTEALITWLERAFGSVGYLGQDLKTVQDPGVDFCSGAFNRGWSPKTLWATTADTTVVRDEPLYVKDQGAPSAWDISYGSSDLHKLLSPTYQKNKWYVRLIV